MIIAMWNEGMRWGWGLLIEKNFTVKAREIEKTIQEAYEPHRLPQKPVQINKHIKAKL